MKRIHFIAIGGAAMHNLAIALQKKGYEVTGSDDEIFEPSRSRLASHGLLPAEWGWHPSRIENSIDAIILGMHAKEDNPELKKALDLGIRVYSYPEFLYEQTKDKKRIVIAGSHGKTSITAMIIHVLKSCNFKFDFMVGSQIEGFDTMVSLNDASEIAVFEGDEYLSSPLDLQPKFMHYKPHIALISGIAWDHINVFPTWEEYLEQFYKLTEIIQTHGHLIYFSDDRELKSLAVKAAQKRINLHPYKEHKYKVLHEITYLISDDNQDYKLRIFGSHNLQNISGAKLVCNLAGIGDDEFYNAITNFSGTARRLQLIGRTGDSFVFNDFAHSPSKVSATVSAVRNQYKSKTLIAVLELHTFSSLNHNFMSEYKDTLNLADQAIIYFNQHVIKHKGLQEFTDSEVKEKFNNNNLEVISDLAILQDRLKSVKLSNTVVLLMSSGNFGGLDIDTLFNS